VKILITNDDGIHAPGIYYLKKSLEKIADVEVVAPDSERSAVGHAITLSDPLRVFSVNHSGEFFGSAVNGTPADCVKLALSCLMETKPDLVVSGINAGANTAMNIIYSGTVSAAAEAVIMGVPAMAVSIASFNVSDYSYAAELAAELAKKIHANGLPEGTLINVNVPPVPREEIRGIVIARQGRGRYQEFFDKRIDPNQRTYYWLAGKKLILDSENDVDDVVIQQNKVAITPVHYELTNLKMIDELKKWDIEQ
jgi:5'-nucleotidase